MGRAYKETLREHLPRPLVLTLAVFDVRAYPPAYCH